MPIHVSWYLEKHIIMNSMEGHCSVEDSNQTGDAIRQYLASVTEPVFLIQDMRHVESIEFNWVAMLDSAKIVKDPLIQMVINIRKPQNAFVRVAIEFFNRALGISSRDVTSMDEAVDLVTTLAPDLTPLLANLGEHSP